MYYTYSSMLIGGRQTQSKCKRGMVENTVNPVNCG